MLFTPLEIVGYAKWVLLALGIVLLIAGVYVSIQRYNLLGNRDKNDKGNKASDQKKASVPTPLSSAKSRRRSPKVVAEESKAKRENSASASSVSISYIE